MHPKDVDVCGCTSNILPFKTLKTSPKPAENPWSLSRGKEIWVTKLAEDAGGDCGYPAASDGAPRSLENKKIPAVKKQVELE